jgi:VanZ family protein
VRDRRWAIALGIAYALSDEIHQSFVPGREGAPLDFAIDSVGVVFGAVLAARRWT